MISVETLRFERLILQGVTQNHEPIALDLFSNPKLVAHRPNPLPDSPALIAENFSQDVAHWNRHGFGRWLLLLDGSAIGFGGLTIKEGFEGLNISYHFSRSIGARGLLQNLCAER